MATPLLVIIISYLLGSLPMGLILGKSAGVDVRAAGSANIGATNVGRLLGKKMGAMTLAGDSLKALLPMALASWLLTGQPGREIIVLACGAAAFLGHLFPVYLRFRGGKGVATALGVFLFLNPIAVMLVVLIFVVVVTRWRYISAGSLAATALMPAVLYLMNADGRQLLLATAIAALIWLKHRDNIGRLLRGQESKWRTPPGRKDATRE